VRCIEPAAEANLNDCGCDLLLAERFKDGADENLKLGRGPNAPLYLISGIKGACDRLGERERRKRLTVDLHPLAIAHQMWFWCGCVPNPRGAEGG
jgi:hypothetical protein